VEIVAWRRLTPSAPLKRGLPRCGATFDEIVVVLGLVVVLGF